MGLKRKIFKTEIVEKPITDATAVPDDVSKGKVFYNNDGRQVGTGDFLILKKFTHTFVNSGSGTYWDSTSHSNYNRMIIRSDGLLGCKRQGNESFDIFEKITLPFQPIGFSIGDETNIYFIKAAQFYVTGGEYEPTNCHFVADKINITSGANLKGKTIHFYGL